MNNKSLLKGAILPVAVMCSALTFNPFFGVLSANADTQMVQQQSIIKGNVVDDHGESVIGATVLIVGGNASQGTITDFDGNFSISVNPGAKLKISYVGFDTQTIAARNGMKVVLKSNAVNLSGVEVVAYGVQKKVTVTGALSSVKGEDLVRTPVSSVNNILAGQLSGITTVQYSGEPGNDAASVFVRGKATFNNADPLVQVDGVERSMADIDPNEIESITVLKDASATAVFGVRGANGVILITTKRGQEGKAKISGNTSFSILTPTKMIEQANSYEYATFYNQMCDNDGQPHAFSDVVIQKFKDHSDPIRYPDTKWDDYIMKNSTLQTQHNVSISGGTKKVRYFINIGAFTQGGLFKEFNMPYHYGYQYNRFNYRSNLDVDITNTTTVSFNVAGNVSTGNRPLTSGGAEGLIKAMYQATPFSSPGLVDGKLVTAATDYTDMGTDQLPFVGGSGMTYYAYSGSRAGFTQTNTNKSQMDLQLTQKLDFLTKGLLFKVKGSYNSTYYVYKGGQMDRATYTPVLLSDGTLGYKKAGTDGTQINYSDEDTGKARDWYFETSLNYNRSFGLHSITALVLYNQSKTYYPSSYSDIPHGYVGFVGRVTYDWNNRYMAEFNIGRNGSENFAPGKRFGTFPAASVGWIASEEPFWKPIKKYVSFMKLRASWGLVGNDQYSGSRFMYLADPYGVNSSSYMSRGGYGYNFGINNSTVTKGAYESSKNNPDVTWEKAFKQDYGVDVNFLNDRLRATFDYYHEHRTDILLTDQTAPGLIGFSVPVANLGVVNSWGWELSLKWQDKIGQDFRYWIGTNLSYNQNKVIEEKEKPYNNAYQYAKGHRIGARSQYLFFEYYEEPSGSNAGTAGRYKAKYGEDMPTQLVSELKAGDAVYVDLDHNGKIDGDDMSRNYGNTDDPKYMAGINMGFTWKNLTFNAQWTAAWDVSRMLSDVFMQPFFCASNTTQGGLLKYQVEHSWTTENPSQSAEYPRATWTNALQNYTASTLYEKDSKYLRLKTLQVAYDFHFPFMKHIGMNQMQLALSGYNLLTFTPYLWGDPETRSSSSPSYPLQRTYTLSLKIGF
jgi:TonB-linked SusC/RagA family outer membrane protein